MKICWLEGCGKKYYGAGLCRSHYDKKRRNRFEPGDDLELWSSRQPAGQRILDKLIWALEILEIYDAVKYNDKREGGE